MQDSATDRRLRSLCVLFTDVVGSREIYSRLGDADAIETIKRQEGICLMQIVRNKGRFIKTQGDSVMATFEQTESAVQAAFAINRELTRYNRDPMHGQPVQVSIGIHCGKGVSEGVLDRPDRTAAGRAGPYSWR